jgi:hypothetical protein
MNKGRESWLPDLIECGECQIEMGRRGIKGSTACEHRPHREFRNMFCRNAALLEGADPEDRTHKTVQ